MKDKIQSSKTICLLRLVAHKGTLPKSRILPLSGGRLTRNNFYNVFSRAEDDGLVRTRPDGIVAITEVGEQALKDFTEYHLVAFVDALNN